MELVEGFRLSSHTRPGTLRPSSIAMEIAGQVARALHFAHARGVIHQDITPANLMVASRRIVKVIDSGIARAVDAVRNENDAILGTPAFLSPELVHGAQVDHRRDLFSLGVTLFVLLTGHTPFQATTVAGYATAVGEAPHPAPRLGRIHRPRSLPRTRDGR